MPPGLFRPSYEHHSFTSRLFASIASATFLEHGMNLDKWALLAVSAIMISACNPPNPPAAATPGSPTPPPGPITENLPPSRLDANPPGTPGYVIAPGDPVGPRNSQIIQPGGKPAF